MQLMKQLVPVEKQNDAFSSHVRITEQIEEWRFFLIGHTILAVIIKKRIQSFSRHLDAIFQGSALQQILRFLEATFRQEPSCGFGNKPVTNWITVWIVTPNWNYIRYVEYIIIISYHQ